MAEKKYDTQQIEALKASDSFLTKEATEKYAIYKSKDPFPKVGQALLNSADLLMYILTVGIVEPFEVNNLKGVTYACTFSGEAHRFNSDTGGMEEINLSDENELILEQNSITYLKIKEIFHVPEYMVLRFNLSVSNAYKGVLLGTGPIVDPGFEGSLFIPLHNLTGNKYIIKKGAPLIRVEFTKLSTNTEWKASEEIKKNIPGYLKPITKETPLNAGFSVFFDEALLDSEKKMFYTSGGVASVRSSIPDAISAAAAKVDEAHSNAESSAKNAKAAAKSAENTKKYLHAKIRKWSLIGSFGVVFAVATLMVSVCALIQDTNSRYDGIVKEMKDYKQQVYALEQEIEMLHKKNDQNGTTQSQSSEQQSEKNTSDETTDLTTTSSNGT